ncbi:flagellar hook-length control protein FliK [Legionella spiritensis]|uniref:Putative flagellar hook-length control protein n=1 Tax=Legionella spiritensis TaxID=452 RepID=A0A0W0Z7Y9_LEGSP|nr:flagellar hook-length control protein FliK [Legionella spiritensis]KTD65220.1 putative flagellar hook-length control protein [Legionella spiritensis]SNV39686.1 flagellar hook-length control protein FliK [Legionella spiritensis]
MIDLSLLTLKNPIINAEEPVTVSGDGESEPVLESDSFLEMISALLTDKEVKKPVEDLSTANNTAEKPDSNSEADSDKQYVIAPFLLVETPVTPVSDEDMLTSQQSEIIPAQPDAFVLTKDVVTQDAQYLDDMIRDDELPDASTNQSSSNRVRGADIAVIRQLTKTEAAMEAPQKEIKIPEHVTDDDQINTDKKTTGLIDFDRAYGKINRFDSDMKQRDDRLNIIEGVTENNNGNQEQHEPVSSVNSFTSGLRASEMSLHNPPAKNMELPAHVFKPEWSEQFNQQIVWLGQQKINSAHIRLNPQDFGPLEVNISINKEDASLSIATHSTHVRDLIEQAIPRLKDMLAEQGVNLTEVTIESSDHRQRQSANQDSSSPTLEQSGPDSDAVSSQEPVPIKKTNGLIDYFA